MSRCGQDTDCNTATAAAVLGIISGYEAIHEVLKSHIPAIADECFAFTDYSYNKAVSQTMAFIDENVVKVGGEVTDNAYLFYTIDLPAGHHKLKLVSSAERNPRSSVNKLYVEKILAYK